MHPDKYQVLHLAAFVSQSCMASIEQCLLWFARSALGGAIKPFPVSQYMAIKRSSPLGEKKTFTVHNHLVTTADLLFQNV